MEVENFREILKKNSYPSKLIPIVPKKEVFIVLQFLGTRSSNLKQKLRTYFKNALRQCNIKIILKSTNHFSSLFRFKGVNPKELQSHLVYISSCGNCSVTYYRKTEHHLNVKSSLM